MAKAAGAGRAPTLEHCSRRGSGACNASCIAGSLLLCCEAVILQVPLGPFWSAYTYSLRCKSSRVQGRVRKFFATSG